MKTLLLSLCLALPIAAKGPANDNFSNASQLHGLYPITFSGSFTDSLDRFRATKEIGEPDHAGQKGHGSVWYKIVTNKDRRLQAVALSQNMQLILAVYTGSSVDDLTLVQRYKNFASPAFSRKNTEPFSNEARVEFDATEGVSYYFAIDSENPVDRRNNINGNFYLTVQPIPNKLDPLIELLPAGSTWDFLLATDPKGAPINPKSIDPDFYYTWMFPKRYDGPKFHKGRAPIGYGQIDGFKKIRSNLLGEREKIPPLETRYSAYCRTTFTPPIDVTAIGIEGIIDDGAIVYLNGKEIRRINISAFHNPQDWRTLAEVPQLPFWPKPLTTETYIHQEVIEGLNLPADEPATLSLSLHNFQSSSSDLGMDLRVYAVNPGAHAD